ncbi:MAG: hypothetical protein ABIP80_01075 [Ferruginibacter sp.]
MNAPIKGALHPIFAAALAPFAPPPVITLDQATRARIDAIKGITEFRVYDNLYDLSRRRADEYDDDDELPDAADQMIP